MSNKFSFDFLVEYNALRKAGIGPEGNRALVKVAVATQHFLKNTKTIELTSMVTGKSYFAFETDKKKSRAVNLDLFKNDDGLIGKLEALVNGKRGDLTAREITETVYSVAIGFCAAVDLVKVGDQKTPGTFFEYLTGLLFHSAIGIKPKKELPILNLDLNTVLPTDFIFDLGSGKPKFHLPVKTSTRERSIQIWAHQRVLDGVYGTGRFLGIPVILAETKTDTNTLKVTEICLPQQWRLYQLHIAQLWRIIYLDTPRAYLALNDVFPPLNITTIGEFLCADGELDQRL